jgi:hypothetical protein
VLMPRAAQSFSAICSTCSLSDMREDDFSESIDTASMSAARAAAASVTLASAAGKPTGITAVCSACVAALLGRARARAAPARLTASDDAVSFTSQRAAALLTRKVRERTGGAGPGCSLEPETVARMRKGVVLRVSLRGLLETLAGRRSSAMWASVAAGKCSMMLAACLRQLDSALIRAE